MSGISPNIQVNSKVQKQRTLKHRNTQNGSKCTNNRSQTTIFWPLVSKFLFPKRSTKTIDGSEDRKRQLAFEKSLSQPQLQKN